MTEYTTEITLAEDELVEIVRKHFEKVCLVHHGKPSSTRGSMFFDENEDVYRFEFKSKTEGREIPET